uniref:Uncharacterized protein n=1 Tax=Cajanus cajan TaxID=3821 RepID=A0A151U8E0_CAJCA|nr:hypothetical protein KK1_019786 [Cajanus cajan]
MLTVEKLPREMMLRREFASAVGYLNQILPVENHLRFIHWDFHKLAKSKSASVLAVSGKPSIIKRANKSNRTSTGRFLGYFQPQEGKPALWELDSDYYLHVSGIGDDLIPERWRVLLVKNDWH